MATRRWAMGAAVSAALWLAAGARAQPERAQVDGRGPADGERARREEPRPARQGARAKQAPPAKRDAAASGEGAARGDAEGAPAAERRERAARGGVAAGTPGARKAVPQQRTAQEGRRPVHGPAGGTGAERGTTAGEQVGAASAESAESPVEPPAPPSVKAGEPGSHARGGPTAGGRPAAESAPDPSGEQPRSDRR